MTSAGDFSWAAIGAAVGSVITGLFSWLVQRSKSGTDIEVAVIAEWQKLNSALSDRVSELERQISDLRRTHADEMDEMRKKHRAEMRQLRELNEGLQRQIAQNSQSAATLIGDLKPKRDEGDAL